MNVKTTLLLLIAGLGAGAWVWWDVRHRPEKEREYGPLLANFPCQEIYRLEVDRPAAKPEGGNKRERLVFEKKGKQWRLTEPLEGPVDERKVEAIIELACTRWSSHYVPAAPDPGPYGLGPEALRVTLRHPGGQAVLRIGRRSDFEGAQYAQVEGAARIALMDMDFSRPCLLPVRAYLRAAEAKESASKTGSPPVHLKKAPPKAAQPKP